MSYINRVTTAQGEEMKFKKGELVCLSASGKRNKQNNGQHEGFGIVWSHVPSDKWPYKLKWFGARSISKCEIVMKEYEIKRFKVNK